MGIFENSGSILFEIWHPRIAEVLPTLTTNSSNNLDRMGFTK